MKRNLYLDDTSREQAISDWHAALNAQGFFRLSMTDSAQAETLAVTEALGRVTATAVYATSSSPHYRAAAMDGVALAAEATFGASEAHPLRIRVPHDAAVVDTGDPVAEGYDAVIKIEDLNPVEEGVYEIIAAAYPGMHVRQIGEDVTAGEMVLPQGVRIGPFEQGVLLAAGCTRVVVRPRVKVAILPTGDELVSPGTEAKPGDIVEYNGTVLSGLASECGASPTVYPITPDDRGRLLEVFRQAVAEHDIVCINAGSSAGRDDYTRSIVEECGLLSTHGVAVKPGHPVILGVVDGKAVVGVPGYPVSAALCFELFIRPLLFQRLGLAVVERDRLEVVTTRPLHSPLGYEERVRVRIGEIGGRYVATPIGKGAGALSSLMRSDGLIVVPRLSEGIDAEQPVSAQLFRSRAEIDQALVLSGSHDLTIDLLNDLLHASYPGASISSANLGSMGGLSAVARREAHAAGTHLLDPETGEYNTPFVRKLITDRDVVLLQLVYRQQGFIVAAGNPLGIKAIGDLSRLRFINRQRGSGTRILLDKLLSDAGITAEAVAGYKREEYTHLAVATAVAHGSVDAALGIYSAAQALGLGFVPLLEERYDLCIPCEELESPRMARLLEVVSSAAFRTGAEALGGYSTRDTGTVIYDSRTGGGEDGD